MDQHAQTIDRLDAVFSSVAQEFRLEWAVHDVAHPLGVRISTRREQMIRNW